MPGTVAEQQAARVIPPRRTKCFGLQIDTTARKYALSQLAFGSTAPEAANSQHREVFLTLQADGAKVYYRFRDDAGAADLDTTTVIAAGGTLAFGTAGGAGLITDGARVSECVTRSLDLFLEVKTAAGTATLWVWAASDEQGGP